MKLIEGLTFSIKTKTKDDIFGECIYRIDKIGLDKKPDAVVCVMVAGSGPAARPGYTVIDTVANLEKNFDSGNAKVVDASGYSQSTKPGAAGVCEFDA